MNDSTSSRRRFFAKAGAALSAPLAVGATSLAGAGTERSRASTAEQTDDIRRIGELVQNLAHHLNAGDRRRLDDLFVDATAIDGLHQVRSLSPARFDSIGADKVDLAGHSAMLRLPCSVALESDLDVEGTLADMARLQGNALSRRTEQRLLTAELVKDAAQWRFRRVALMDA